MTSFSLYDKKVRAVLYQLALAAGIAAALVGIAVQTVSNMQQRGIPLTFHFWDQTAGFSINQALIPYDSLSTLGQAFWVGLLNTLLVSALGILFASIIGFVVGISRLSNNWIAAKAAAGYIEIVRNVPLLLQLLFWYNAVLTPLPRPKAAIHLWGGIVLSNRGIIFPSLEFHGDATAVIVALACAVAACLALIVYGRRRQRRTGRQPHVMAIGALIVMAFPISAFMLSGAGLGISYPVLHRFNFTGGLQLDPEFAALLLGLSIYTATYIAEIVRGGIQAISRGQSEAAYALGLSHTRALRLVVVPQALRIIIPPLTSQYLNLLKNSSLAVFIGYPDLVQVFAGSVLNATGAAVQVMAITLGVYLLISLLTSAAMNAFNSRLARVER